MKKILTLIVLTAIAFAAVGCSQPAEGDTKTTTGTTGTTGTADDSGKTPDGGTKTPESH